MNTMLAAFLLALPPAGALQSTQPDARSTAWAIFAVCVVFAVLIIGRWLKRK
jgi:hypothetical protein